MGSDFSNLTISSTRLPLLAQPFRTLLLRLTPEFLSGDKNWAVYLNYIFWKTYSHNITAYSSLIKILNKEYVCLDSSVETQLFKRETRTPLSVGENSGFEAFSSSETRRTWLSGFSVISTWISTRFRSLFRFPNADSPVWINFLGCCANYRLAELMD